MAKRQKSVLSIITIISIIGVALGVTALIVVLSVMGGFKKDLFQKILGTKAHIVVQAQEGEPLKQPTRLADELLKRPHIIGASPFIEAEAMISSPSNLSGIVLRGIDINHVTKVNRLKEEMTKGKLDYLVDPAPLLEELEKAHNKELFELREKLRKSTKSSDDKPFDGEKKLAPSNANASDTDITDLIADIPDDTQMPSLYGDDAVDDSFADPLADVDLPDDDFAALQDALNEDSKTKTTQVPTILLGAELANNLKVQLGDEVNVVTPNGGMGPTGPIPKSRPFIVVGVFYTGMYEFDSNYAYTSLASASDFVGVEGANGIDIKLDDVNRSAPLARELQAEFPDWQVEDWEALNKSLFFALKIEKLAMFIILTFIILVASFSIVAMLIMIVIEKGREIAIIVSMGATKRGIMSIFIFQGTLIGAVGSILGTIGGISICLFLKYVGIGLDPEVYYISTLPVEMNTTELVVVVCSALAISIFATLYPAYQAAALTPVQGLRDD